MREKLMVGTHRYTTKEYAEGWDRIFGKKNPSCHTCWYYWPCMQLKTEADMWRWVECEEKNMVNYKPN